VGEAGHRDRERHERVRRVELVEIEPVDAEAPRARVRSPPHDRRDWQDGVELRRQEHVVAAVGDRGADDALRAAVRVDLGRVDNVDAEIERATRDRPGLTRRVRLAVPPLTRAELPRPETDHGQPRPADADVAHGVRLVEQDGIVARHVFPRSPYRIDGASIAELPVAEARATYEAGVPLTSGPAAE